MEPLLDLGDVGALLVEQMLPEAVLPVHLEDEAAKVADAFLAQPQKRAALAAQVARRPADGSRGVVQLGARASERGKQRPPSHRAGGYQWRRLTQHGAKRIVAARL